MVRCLTDFSCWEIIAKLAPLGTALIVLIAAIIALGAMWVQMHIARRRANAIRPAAAVRTLNRFLPQDGDR
jgi:hypothetical protein